MSRNKAGVVDQGSAVSDSKTAATGSVTIPAVRVEEPTPKPEPETVQTPAPNSGAIVDHLMSISHSVLGSMEATARTNQERLDTVERGFHARFDAMVEQVDRQHREAIRGMALTFSSEVEQVKADVRELVSEVRGLARLITLNKGDQ